VQGADGAQDRSVCVIHEDPSTVATPQLAGWKTFRKKSAIPINYYPMKHTFLLTLFTFTICTCTNLFAADATTTPPANTTAAAAITATQPQTETPKADRIKELNDIINSDGSKKLVEDIKKATKLDYVDQPWFFSSWLIVVMNNRDGKSNYDVLGNGPCTSLECSYSIRYYAKQFHNNLIMAYNFFLLSPSKDLQTSTNTDSFNKLIAALEEIYSSEPKPANK
jgi:hypothetical protein